MVDREGAVVESNTKMLSVHALTTQLRSQTLRESQTTAQSSSHDGAAAKMRHHSEPHPPASFLTDPSKKVKIITFQDGLDKDGVSVASILLNAESSSCDAHDSTLNPAKRQCRSMSIPNDGELHQHWLQTQARSHIHRPLALRPNANNSRSKSHQSSHRSYAGRSLPPVWSTLSNTNSATPPESPRSRPSSASSGYFDSPLASSSNLNKHRCESLQTLPSLEYNACSPSAHSNSLRVNSAKSMPSVADPSVTSSPSKQLLLPRCQSQPCVVHERRCGVKRRLDDNRPSINFNKMTETALNSPVSERTLSAIRLSSPLKMKPVARYGILPERVLQTIACSPQDTNHIITSTSNSPPSLPLPAPSPAACRTDANDSDSGCSTTDDELCDITNKMAAPVDGVRGCVHKASACACSGEAELEAMFVMEPHQDSELDIDMIENN